GQPWPDDLAIDTESGCTHGDRAYELTGDYTGSFETLSSPPHATRRPTPLTRRRRLCSRPRPGGGAGPRRCTRPGRRARPWGCTFTRRGPGSRSGRLRGAWRLYGRPWRDRLGHYLDRLATRCTLAADQLGDQPDQDHQDQ